MLHFERALQRTTLPMIFVSYAVALGIHSLLEQACTDTLIEGSCGGVVVQSQGPKHTTQYPSHLLRILRRSSNDCNSISQWTFHEAHMLLTDRASSGKMRFSTTSIAHIGERDEAVVRSYDTR